MSEEYYEDRVEFLRWVIDDTTPEYWYHIYHHWFTIVQHHRTQHDFVRTFDLNHDDEDTDDAVKINSSS